MLEYELSTINVLAINVFRNSKKSNFRISQYVLQNIDSLDKQLQIYCPFHGHHIEVMILLLTMFNGAYIAPN